MSRYAAAIVALFALAVMTALPAAPSAAAEMSATSDDAKAVKAAVDQWFVVLNAMLNGDPKPFAALYSHADDATYMGAEGTYRVGWDAIYGDWVKQAKKSTGGKVEGVDVRIIVGSDMATAVHVTKGTVRQPDGKTTEIAARETSVFRKEDGQWRMVGHHADSLNYWVDAFQN